VYRLESDIKEEKQRILEFELKMLRERVEKLERKCSVLELRQGKQ
jgi:hypothetical protein